MERWSTLGLAINAMNRGDAYDAVLKEQAVQREEGKYCDERIAQNYRNVSQRCQNKALKLARQDAIEASKYTAKGDSPPTSLDESWQQEVTTPACSKRHSWNGGCHKPKPPWDVSFTKREFPPTRLDASWQQLIVTAVCTKRHTGQGESHKQHVPPRYIVFAKGTGRETDASPMITATPTSATRTRKRGSRRASL
jgi:hypothetical protein